MIGSSMSTISSSLFRSLLLLSFAQQSYTSSIGSFSSPHTDRHVKRLACDNFDCPQGQILERSNFPDCSYSCYTPFSTTIQVFAAVIAGVAAAGTAMSGYAAIRNIQNHQQVARGEFELKNITTPFDGLVKDLFGSHDHPNISHHDRYAGTLIGQLDNLRIHVQEYETNVTTIINADVPENALVRRQSEMLTGAKVIFHNALVSGSVQTRAFSDYERKQIGNAVANHFETTCNHYGRTICECLKSGLGDGWVGSMTVEGQANNNGYYQFAPCDCDTPRDEL